MKYLLKDLCLIKNGKDYKNIENKNGKYPVLGTGGIITYTDSYLYNGKSVLIGRKGTINKPKYIEGKFWTVDTLFYTEIFENICVPRFLYYYLSQLDLLKLDEGTSIPSLTQSSLYKMELDIPPIERQRHIVDIMR